MKKYIILFLWFAGSLQLQAQSLQRNVLGAAGKVYTAGTYQISFTVGEVATHRYLAGSGVKLNQGFQQNFSFNLPLPITGLDFYAQRVTPSLVELQWQTLTESNNKGFYLERKLDNEIDFISRDFIHSKADEGHSSVQLRYAWVDTNAYTGKTYYRIKQEDIDGKNSYSLVRVVPGDPTGNMSLLVWPNPSSGFFNIQVMGNGQPQEIEVYDAQGRRIKRIQLRNQQSYRVDGLAPGTYFVRVPHDAHLVQKIIVQ